MSRSPRVPALLCLFVAGLCSAASAVAKEIGPLGIWRASNGVVYRAPDIPESTAVQDAFAFGDFWNMNDPGDEGLTFRQWIDRTCEEWDAERVVGVVRPPSEGGVLNVPADTSLYEPAWPPGIIQGAVRFSRLSRIHGQIYGINIDDFGGLDTAAVHDVRDALRGKYVDGSGVVHHDTPETTPQLKLFVVIYSGHVLAAQYRPFIDGINLWIYNQNAYYQNIDTYVNQFRASYPEMEINCGIYVYNSDYHWMTPAGIRWMYRHLFDRYDDGDVNGVMLFAGHWIVIPNIPRATWDNDHIPALLDSIYYPYLGRGTGRVYDEQGQPAESAFVSCRTVGRVSGDTLIRSLKRTEAQGEYRFDAWAGNRTTDSTLYIVQARKGELIGPPVYGWLTRGGSAVFPDIVLRSPAGLPVPGTRAGAGQVSTGIPNPFAVESGAGSIIRYVLPRAGRVALSIFDSAGAEVTRLLDVFQQAGAHQERWDGRDASGRPVPAGVYYYRVTAGGFSASGRTVVVR